MRKPDRCKLTLDECIALFPTAEIFQAAWFLTDRND